MARPIACDQCSAEEAVIMMSYLTEGVTTAVGPLCLPGYMIGLITALGIVPDGWMPPMPDAPAEVTGERLDDAASTPKAPVRPKGRQRAAETPA